jgi:hypothetical protein
MRTAEFRVALSTILLLLFATSAAPAELTYKEYAKEQDAWKRGYVFGISRYMSVVAQPDEEPPYPLRATFQRCLASTTDGILVRKVESYVAANRASSQGPRLAGGASPRSIFSTGAHKFPPRPTRMARRSDV